MRYDCMDIKIIFVVVLIVSDHFWLFGHVSVCVCLAASAPFWGKRPLLRGATFWRS